MGLEAGYSYITLDSWTPSLNPTEFSDSRAEKKIVPITTLTKTITQHWTIAATDKTISMKWDKMSKADKDTLVTKYEAAYTSYAFTDVYGVSYSVVISDLTWARLSNMDSDGFEVSMSLQVVQ